MPILQRNACSKALHRLIGCDLVDMMCLLLKSNDAEMLAKTRQYSLLQYMLQHGYKSLPHRPSVIIALRNGYYIDNPTMWLDYIDLLEHFGLDTHNAHYVCPALLTDAHDKLVVRRRIERERQWAEERRRDLAAAEQSYARRRSRYFALTISDEAIDCRVLRDVEEFIAEGEAMHHCVFDNEYYSAKKHPNALILSARDKSGNRLETVEVNLKTMQVVQSRGVCNGTTAMHDRIINLVSSNMPLIQKAKQV